MTVWLYSNVNVKKVLDGRWLGGGLRDFLSFVLLWGWVFFCFEDMNYKNLVLNSKMKYRFYVDYGSTEFVASIIIFNSIQIKN